MAILLFSTPHWVQEPTLLCSLIWGWAHDSLWRVECRRGEVARILNPVLSEVMPDTISGHPKHLSQQLVEPHICQRGHHRPAEPVDMLDDLRHAREPSQDQPRLAETSRASQLTLGVEAIIMVVLGHSSANGLLHVRNHPLPQLPRTAP